MLLTRRLCVLFVVATVTVKQCLGIYCWVCDGKKTLKECHAQYGQMLKCPNDDDVCQNDYRTAEGKPLITKGCKQARACETEVKQNKDKNQCGRKKMKKNMVCRCCCTTDGCNSKESGCIPPPAPCKAIKSPQNGQSVCPKYIDFGSQCFFRCNQGYKRAGPVRAICVRDSKGSKTGHWRPGKSTVCNKIIIRCDPPRTAPENGYINCRNTKEYAEEDEYNYEGSKCTYGCKRNFYLKGKKVAVCGNNRKWDSARPRCLKGRCKNTQVDPNRIEKCTDGYDFGSKCDFTCKKGFTLIGSEQSLCQQSGLTSQGFWSKSFPRCAEVLCYPRLTNPANGKVTCTKDNLKNSVCTYTCNRGYDLDRTRKKSVESVCEDDGDGDALGRWSRKPPFCSRVRCEPEFRGPKGGRVVCSDRNMFGSVCTFSCDGAHDLEGTTESIWESVCQDDGDGDKLGKWSQSAVGCKAITCEPAFESSKYEKVSCTSGNAGNSVCTFSCANDYDLDGTVERYQTSTCLLPKDGTAVGTWTRTEPPKCTVITCSPQPFPENGFRICSTFNNMRGTFCVFYCDDGYDRIGQSYMSCQRGKIKGSSKGEWTAATPSCRLGQCSETKYDKRTVVEECTPPKGYKTSEYRVGTVCRYRCKSDAYYMVPNTGNDPVLDGVTTSTCNTEKKWTKMVPRCLMKTCLPALSALASGYQPKCTNGNNFGSKCVFSCKEKYAPTHARPLVCASDGDNDQFGRWSEEIPKCKRSHCDEFGTVLNGRLNCTDGTKIGSICALECIDRYTTKRYEVTECLPVAVWSRRRNFCCVRCLFNRRMKITAIFDSPAYKTREDWNYIVDFTRSYLSLMVHYDLDIQFAALTYGDDVNVHTLIPLTRLRRENDVEGIVDDLNNMHHGGDVTYTGKALEYVDEVIFERIDRRREHFVIVASAGRSTDDVRDISRKLRDKKINILATGFKVDKGGRRELLEMTGTPKNVFVTPLRDMKNVPAKIFEISRETGCTTASKTQVCP